MSQTTYCAKHSIHIHGDSAMGCSRCFREKHRAGHANSPEVIACVDRIKKAIGKEHPAVAMNACYMMMQAIEFLWLTEANQEKGHAE